MKKVEQISKCSESATKYIHWQGLPAQVTHVLKKQQNYPYTNQSMSKRNSKLAGALVAY